MRCSPFFGICCVTSARKSRGSKNWAERSETGWSEAAAVERSETATGAQHRFSGLHLPARETFGHPSRRRDGPPEVAAAKRQSLCSARHTTRLRSGSFGAACFTIVWNIDHWPQAKRTTYDILNQFLYPDGIAGGQKNALATLSRMKWDGPPGMAGVNEVNANPEWRQFRMSSINACWIFFSSSSSWKTFSLLVLYFPLNQDKSLIFHPVLATSIKQWTNEKH